MGNGWDPTPPHLLFDQNLSNLPESEGLVDCLDLFHYFHVLRDGSQGFCGC